MNKFAKKLAIKVIKTMAQAALGVIGSSAPADRSKLDCRRLYCTACRVHLCTNEPFRTEGGRINDRYCKLV